MKYLIVCLLMVLAACQPQEKSSTSTNAPASTMSAKASGDFSDFEKEPEEGCELEEEPPVVEEQKPFQLQGGEPGCETDGTDEKEAH